MNRYAVFANGQEVFGTGCNTKEQLEVYATRFGFEIKEVPVSELDAQLGRFVPVNAEDGPQPDLTAKLDYREVHAYYVDAFELDEFIAKVYGLLNFEGTLESSNDTTHEVHAKKGGNDSDWERKSLADFIKQGGCEHYSLGTVLNDLADKGLIPEGKWFIRVSW